jgi:putative SOS response-associated peptidase YedK
VRKKQEGEHLLLGFPTTEANGTVCPIHGKALPVVLRTPEELDQWMNAQRLRHLPYSDRCHRLRCGFGA